MVRRVPAYSYFQPGQVVCLKCRGSYWIEIPLWLMELEIFLLGLGKCARKSDDKQGHSSAWSTPSTLSLAGR
jgi:hypothetical protein